MHVISLIRLKRNRNRISEKNLIISYRVNELQLNFLEILKLISAKFLLPMISSNELSLTLSTVWTTLVLFTQWMGSWWWKDPRHQGCSNLDYSSCSRVSLVSTWCRILDMTSPARRQAGTVQSCRIRIDRINIVKDSIVTKHKHTLGVNLQTSFLNIAVISYCSNFNIAQRGASQWRIYYHTMWGQLSTTCSNLLK